ncbi:MAG: TIGR03620 family F420-dependent LLM class oxidoreductase [Novosphingobium sp.]
MDLGRIGVWSMELRFGDKGEASAAAAEIETLGYGAIWVPGGIGGDVTGDIDHLLAATQAIAIATGIINVWKHEPEEIFGWFGALPAAQQSRVMLGLGISHGPLIGEAWMKPLAKMREYVDAMHGGGVPPEHMCLAALGPKMLELAGERTAGAHPYLVSPAHTAMARKVLGPGKLLAPEQGVVLESDPEKARAIARTAVEGYRRLPNYCNNWLRMGLTQVDIDSASDRLIDALFVCGDAAAIKARVDEHFAAGADHVCLQVVTAAGGMQAAMGVLRELAPVLL